MTTETTLQTPQNGGLCCSRRRRPDARKTPHMTRHFLGERAVKDLAFHFPEDCARKPGIRARGVGGAYALASEFVGEVLEA